MWRVSYRFEGFWFAEVDAESFARACIIAVNVWHLGQEDFRPLLQKPHLRRVPA
jgi:hypothetical protein